MFVLFKGSNPICTTDRPELAKELMDFHGWTALQVPSADELRPIAVKKYLVDMINMSKMPTFTGDAVEFAEDPSSGFPDPNSWKVGDTFWRSNLENMQVWIPLDTNALELRLAFWDKLRALGMTIVERVGGKFEIIALPSEKLVAKS